VNRYDDSDRTFINKGKLRRERTRAVLESSTEQGSKQCREDLHYWLSHELHSQGGGLGSQDDFEKKKCVEKRKRERGVSPLKMEARKQFDRTALINRKRKTWDKSSQGVFWIDKGGGKEALDLGKSRGAGHHAEYGSNGGARQE